MSAERGRGYVFESTDDDGNLFSIEVKGRVDGAESVTLTLNELSTGRNAPRRSRLAMVSGGWSWTPMRPTRSTNEGAQIMTLLATPASGSSPRLSPRESMQARASKPSLMKEGRLALLP